MVCQTSGDTLSPRVSLRTCLLGSPLCFNCPWQTTTLNFSEWEPEKFLWFDPKLGIFRCEWTHLNSWPAKIAFFAVTVAGVVAGVTVVLSLVLRCPLELFFYINHSTDPAALAAMQAACRRALTFMWGVGTHKQQLQCLSCAPVSNFQKKFDFVCRTVWDPVVLSVLWNLQVAMVQTDHGWVRSACHGTATAKHCCQLCSQWHCTAGDA